MLRGGVMAVTARAAQGASLADSGSGDAQASRQGPEFLEPGCKSWYAGTEFTRVLAVVVLSFTPPTARTVTRE